MLAGREISTTSTRVVIPSIASERHISPRTKEASGILIHPLPLPLSGIIPEDLFVGDVDILAGIGGGVIVRVDDLDADGHWLADILEIKGGQGSDNRILVVEF